MTDGLPILLEAKLKAEFELAHYKKNDKCVDSDAYAKLEHRIALLRQVLRGLSTNASQCGMCKMHNEIYEETLARDEKLAGSR